jgi:hypothetical protein
MLGIAEVGDILAKYPQYGDKARQHPLDVAKHFLDLFARTDQHGIA